MIFKKIVSYLTCNYKKLDFNSLVNEISIVASKLFIVNLTKTCQCDTGSVTFNRI
jgi:hypothetical protein